MKRYIKNLMFFVVSSIIITLVLSSTIQGSNSVINLSKNIHITDKAIEREVILYNFLNDAVEFNIKLNTSPFDSEILEENVFFLPNETKRIKYIIYPLKNSLDQVYTASLEVSFASYNYIEYFTINQAFNRVCEVDLDVNYSFIENNKINLNLLFINNTQTDQSIIVRDVIGATDFLEKRIDVLKDTSYSLDSIITIDRKDLVIEYICNNVIVTENIEIESKNNIFSGFVTFKNINNFLDSVYFKILLIVFLIVLVLSFATRYLKHVNKK